MKEKKIGSNFRLSMTARTLLTRLAEQGGTTKTAILEAVLRQVAQERGIKHQPRRSE